jgi:hypothetical protein
MIPLYRLIAMATANRPIAQMIVKATIKRLRSGGIPAFGQVILIADHGAVACM